MRSEEPPAFQVRLRGDVLLLSELRVAALEALLAVGTRIWANFVHENWVGFGCVDVSPSGREARQLLECSMRRGIMQT